jgi:site-specific DNA-cytosine methylase
LFCGIGGFHSALSSLGGRCVFASDIDKYAKEVYEKNYGLKPHGDITKIDAEKPYDKAINNVEKMGWTLEQRGETLTENDINFAFCIFKNPNVKTFNE